jgi:hypothetical protein
MLDDPTTDLPIACDLSAMDASQRQRHQAAIATWRQQIQEIVELTDGYAFRFPPDESLCLALAEFMALERRCCPFLGFTLALDPEGGPLWLRLTGREGTKPFLRAAFGIADSAVGA